MRTHGIALSPRWDNKPAYTLKFSPNRAARHPESRKLSQNATVLMARIRLAFRWPRQYFITCFLLVSNLLKSTVGMLRSALKYPLIQAAINTCRSGGASIMFLHVNADISSMSCAFAGLHAPAIKRAAATTP